ncbi:hypothetical protein CVT24_011554 [Panaeolus cyanescens]|uniref:Uncharacterized protein n=1 Tax=Panaeolus cyanescens TaxID=181874 RepID=A0A409VLT3_9AGAR|nr:hypothetical protein CVT24_011554 [Panaeolus cyanescens]
MLNAVDIFTQTLPSDTITIFDLRCNDSGLEGTVSPWGRLVVNAARIKDIPFHLEHVEMVDIPAVTAMLGIMPVRGASDQTESFSTLPAIYDPRTKVSLCGSFSIVQYLEKQYPGACKLIPSDCEALLASFVIACESIDSKAFQFILPSMMKMLEGTRSEDQFRETRLKALGKESADTLVPKGEEAAKVWADIKRMFDNINNWYGDGMFVMGGDQPTFIDMSMEGRLWWYRSALGPESQEWQDILTWNNGRWGILIAYFDDYYKTI